MKIFRLLLAATFVLSALVMPPAYADRSEKANVIKFDKDQNDLIIKRQNGQHWLIQHNRACTSMSTEFPVTLITDQDEITYLKVDFNEQCQVYNSAPYTGEITITNLIKSENLIIPDHEAEIIWNDKKYSIDYEGSGCRYLREFVDERSYLYLPEDDPGSGYIVLPKNRGQCPFEFTEELGIVENTDPVAPEKLEGLVLQAQNNQVYFYWEQSQENIELPLAERSLYVISYSRHRINPKYYKLKEMPHLIYTRRNSLTIRRLANYRPYHFYLATLNEDGLIGPWTEVEATPAPPKKPKAIVEREKFEVNLEETEDSFRLYWPDEEGAKRYFVRFYVNGGQEYFKILRTDINEILIPKNHEYLNKRLRLTVRTIPKSRFGSRYRDGIYWVYEDEDGQKE